MIKTKIICTLGPSVEDEDSMRALIEHGMNAARFNFSHGTHESHLSMLTTLKRVRDALGVPIAAIMDTKGPEIRIRSIAGGSITLFGGDAFTLTTEDCEGTGERVSVTYPKLHDELSPGCHILIDDGLIELSVTEISGSDIHCTVENGGVLSGNKSINIPEIHIMLPSLTDKDRGDIAFAAENGFDFIAASFVRRAQDVLDIRAELDKNGAPDIRIIAKIENREGVDNFDSIVAVADGVMVARGDLGVEIPAWEVPVLQKKMIKACIAPGKPVIIATQMLDSMIRNPRPTRAEVSDVANAVYDGTSCVMLSGETASGKYPIEALDTMRSTIEFAEKSIDYWENFQHTRGGFRSEITDAISHTSCLTAMDLRAQAILAPTQSGNTVRAISRFRPACSIIALVTREHIRRQLSISWGITSLLYGSVDSTDRLFTLCAECAFKENLVKKGDTVVITAGIPIGTIGGTNLIKATVI